MENLTSGLHFLLSMSIAALLVFITVLIHYVSHPGQSYRPAQVSIACGALDNARSDR